MTHPTIVAHRYVPAASQGAVCRLCAQPKGTTHLKPKALGNGGFEALQRLGHKQDTPAGLETKDRVYHWKHEWIPLDHAAALSKAHGSHKSADRLLALARLKRNEPKSSDPLAGINLQHLTDDKVAALLDQDKVAVSDSALSKVLAELDRRDAAEQAAKKTNVANILSTGAQTDTERAAVAAYFEGLQAADAAARSVSPDALPPPPKRTAEGRRREEYEVNLEHLMSQALDATSGNLMSKAGKSSGVSQRTLFEGSSRNAVRYASEELRRYWAGTPASRLTYTEFRAPGTPRARKAYDTFRAELARVDVQTGKRAA